MLRNTNSVSTMWYDVYRDDYIHCIEEGAELPHDIAREVGSFVFGPLNQSSARFAINRYFGSPYLVMVARESVVNIRIDGTNHLMVFYVYDMCHRNVIADEAYDMGRELIRYGRPYTGHVFIDYGNCIRFAQCNRLVVIGTEHWEIEDRYAFTGEALDLANELRLY